MSASALETARRRIANCLGMDEAGRLIQRMEALNLAGLGLEDGELESPFDVPERGLKGIRLAQLRHLEFLDLTGNNLTRLPSGVEDFGGLRWLGLNFNRMRELEGVGKLAGLERLYVRNNPLGTFPDGISRLGKLVELDVTGCGFDRLPQSMGGLEALEFVGLDEDKLVPDQRAAWQEKGWATLRKHLATARDQGVALQFLGKVVLVGAQDNGKTCLQRALRGEPFSKNVASTDGMSRERLSLRMDGSLMEQRERQRPGGARPDVIDLTLWDMGGQESYQHTHQMFFTQWAIYLVVMLPRSGGSVQELDHWIERVKRRTGGEASIVVVSTSCNTCPADASLSFGKLREKHGEAVEDFITLDSADPQTLVPLRQKLADIVQRPGSRFRHSWRRGWAAAFDELSRMQNAYVEWAGAAGACARHGIVAEEEQRQVIRTGHLLGTWTWREDIPDGKEVVILNPDWLSRAVVRLLEDKVTRQNGGLIKRAELGRVWEVKARDGTPGYPARTHDALVRLMEINELAYKPRGAGELGGGDELLVTQMVPVQPPVDVEAAWKRISPANASVSEMVVSFRKPGSNSFEDVQDLVYLLIFRLRDFALDRAVEGPRQKAVHWQKGLLVMDRYGSAARIERESNGLRIIVRHVLTDGLMHSVLHRIAPPDGEFWRQRGLEQIAYIPCARECPMGTPGKGLIDLKECSEARQAGGTTVRCDSCRKHLKIEALVAGAPQRRDGLTDMEGMLARICEVVEALQVQGRSDAETIREEFRRLTVLVGQVEDRILDAFTSEWQDGPRLFSLVPVPQAGWDPRTWMTMKCRLTVWCEVSRLPVPWFRVPRRDGKAGYEGSVEVTLTREWVGDVRRILRWSSGLLWAMGGVGGLGAGTLVSAMGGAALDTPDLAELKKEMAEQQALIKKVLDVMPQEGVMDSGMRDANAGMDPFGHRFPGFGAPVEDDLKLARKLRDLYREQDPAWGGLTIVRDDKFQRLWAHPNVAAGRRVGSGER